jgi:hypothetical protein
MDDLKKPCVCNKFYFKMGKNAMEKFKMLKVCFGEQIMGRT